MVNKHPSGNPGLIEQHKKIQREGDKDLAGTGDDAPQQRKTKQEPERAPEERDSDNSGSKTDGGSFVGP